MRKGGPATLAKPHGICEIGIATDNIAPIEINNIYPIILFFIQ